MKSFNLTLTILMVFGSLFCRAQVSPVFPIKKIVIKKATSPVKIDGEINEPAWKNATVADQYIEQQPKPFVPEGSANRTESYLLYSNEGVYIGGYLHERTKDSIAAELTGRDGFGNNDFFGVAFDTYQDKLNGFEYIITPLNEQWDSKVSNGGNEDFSWNAVWQSAVKMHDDGWSFEIFIPYSAIRFGKKKIQDWGMNLFRQRKKCGEKFFWQSLDPNKNGFLTQEGTLAGFEDIKPPLRLQLSPYFSTYYNHGGEENFGTKDGVSVNGGADIKYGINQAFTLDMTLIPDFGQVQTDDEVLNLSPFERKYAENRPFFTEGTELFNKGNLFYSRRIGGSPLHQYDFSVGAGETVVENPAKSKLINAIKVSGRTQKGLGIGVLNAITKPQYAVIEDAAKNRRKVETDPLTNYNVFVLDQTLKHNSSISFVNTSVLRSGSDYDADVMKGMFDFNDKTNTWNFGGGLSLSNKISKTQTITGYNHNLYFGKVSGRFNFNISHELLNDKYDKRDLGFFNNNNTMTNDLFAAYYWNTPKKWYNRKNINAELFYARPVTAIDFLKRKKFMFGTIDFFSNAYAQTKKLWEFSANLHIGTEYDDYYESRDLGRVWRNKGSKGIDLYAQTNTAKKFSGWVEVFTGTGGAFKRTSFSPSVSFKVRFSSKFSIQETVNVNHDRDAAGFADLKDMGNVALDTIVFSRRNIDGVENVLAVKYSINNKMSINLRLRHSYTKVAPQQLYLLGTDGYLTEDHSANRKPSDYNQNYNFISGDMSYNWQFAQGSFITVAWKDIGQQSGNLFFRNYFKNLGKVTSEDQYTSFSVKFIYFLDYVTLRNKMKAKKNNG